MVCPFFIHQLYCLYSRFVGQSLGSVDHGLLFLSFCHCLCQSFRFCVAFCGAWFILVLHSAIFIVCLLIYERMITPLYLLTFIREETTKQKQSRK